MADLEMLLDDFDQQWRREEGAPVLEEFLRKAGIPRDEQATVLPELVAIDMEYRWRHAERCATGAEATETANLAAAADQDTLQELTRPCPQLEDYARRWPELLHNGVPPADLIAEEFRIRHRWGDRPDESVFVQRFGDSVELWEALQAVRRELRGDAAGSPSGSSAGAAAVREEFQDSQDVDRTLPDLTALTRYRIQDRIGVGGMGVVFLAEDTQLQRRVALKTPFLGADDRLRERFVNEARAAATLHHPGICPVFDVGEIDGQPYLTMAFIDGQSLRELWEQQQPQSIPDVMQLFAQIAEAMQAAHDAGIVHRDLKPANVMLTENNEPVVMDFGLACRHSLPDSERITQTGDVFGSPGYMSPEQVEGPATDVGPAADIYSLGVMLFEALTGRLPFTGSVSAILVRIARDAPPLPSELGVHIDSELEQLCLRMLSKEPGDRPASMRDVAQQLNAIARRLDQGATGPSPTGWTGRYPWAARIALAMVPVLILLGGILFRIQTPYGVLEVRVADDVAPDVRVHVMQDGAVVRVVDQSSGWTVRLEEGEYELTPSFGNEQFEITPRHIEVTRNQKEDAIVSVRVISDSGTDTTADRSTQPALAGEGMEIAVAGFPADRLQILEELNQQKYQEGAWPSSDGLRLYYESVSPDGQPGVLLATRPDVEAAFEFQRWIASGRHPTLSADELVLICLGREGSQPLCESRRESRSDSFTDLVPIESLRHEPAVKSPCLSPDGLRLVYQRNTQDGLPEFAITRRASRDDPWEFPKPFRQFNDYETGDTATWPWLSADGLTILYADRGDPQASVCRATRESVDLPFENFETILVDGVPLSGRSPRFCPATNELFFSTSSQPQQWDLAVLKATSTAQPGARFALSFDGNDDYVQLPLAYDGTVPLTIEGWLTWTSLTNGRSIRQTVIADHTWSADSDEDIGLLLGIHNHTQRYPKKNGVWTGLLGRGAIRSYIYGPQARLDRRMHFALQIDRKQASLYIDGHLAADTRLLPHYAPASRALRLGMDYPEPLKKLPGRMNLEPFCGLIHCLHISHALRYESSFTPPSSLTADGQTVALYYLDEGHGREVRDSSGNGHHGQIEGATWTLLQQQPGSAAVSGAPANSPLSEKRTNLFSVIDSRVRFDEASSQWILGGWTSTPETHTTDSTSITSMPFHVLPQSSRFRIEVDAEFVTGDGDLYLSIPAGDPDCVFSYNRNVSELDNPEVRYAGLNYIDGGELQLPIGHVPMTAGRPVTIAVDAQVEGDQVSLVISADDLELHCWTGPTSRLKPHPVHHTGSNAILSIGAVKGSYVFHRAELIEFVDDGTDSGSDSPGR